MDGLALHGAVRLNALIDEIPVTVLTGFLGSGKSTLLNAMLRHPDMPPTAIIINEFGEVAIDHVLVEGVVEGVTLLASGCVCCAVRSDLEAALRDLHLKRMRGLIPAYRGVVLETTGLADPGPVLQTLTSRSVREFRYRLNAVVATFDAVHGQATLKRHHEAVQQLAMADRIILTKVDLAGPVEDLIAAIRLINPRAALLSAERGRISPAVVLSGADTHGQHVAHANLTGGSHSHTHGISSESRVFNGRFDWERLQPLLADFLRVQGERLLRLKGIVWLDGVDWPMALHAVHHSFYPPERVTGRLDLDQSSLVVIGENMDAATVRQFLDAVEATILIKNAVQRPAG